MILITSIAISLCVAFVGYRVLFYDWSDFLDGCFFISRCFHRGRNKWRKGGALPAPEDLEDESWYSALRFLLFLAITIATGYYANGQLHKYFS